MDEEAITVNFDAKGLEDRLAQKVDSALNDFKKAMTPRMEVEAASETKVSAEPEEFDYRVGVTKWLKENLETNTSLNIERKKVKLPPEEDYFGRQRVLHKAFNLREEIVGERKKVSYSLSESLPLAEAIGSVNPDCCIPEVWADDVERQQIYPGSVFWGAWFVRWERGIQGKPGDKVWICTIGTAVATTIAAACDEPTTLGATFSCKEINLTDYVCAYYLCKNDIESVVPDAIDELNAGLGACLERQIDNYFFDVARTNGCTAGTVTSSSALSGSLIAEAMGSMRNGTYEPVVLIVHPVSMSSLLQDSNFVYACRYGNRDVITGGRVLEWLNLQILMVPKGTLSVGSGSYDSLLLAKNAIAGAIKHGIRIESEYVVRQQRRYVLATVKFGGTCLHPNGIWWIRSTDD